MEFKASCSKLEASAAKRAHLLKFKASDSKLNSRLPKSPPVEIQSVGQPNSDHGRQRSLGLELLGLELLEFKASGSKLEASAAKEPTC